MQALRYFAIVAFSASAAASPQDFLTELRGQAQQEAGFRDFEADRGHQFFHRRHGDWSCSSCHTEDPRQPGKHAVTGKAIEPLAPAVNPARFQDGHKVAKWFRRNCKDVLGRECSPREKGDVLAYLLSLTP